MAVPSPVFPTLPTDLRYGRNGGGPFCKWPTGNQTHVVSKTRAQDRNGNSRIVPK